MRGLLDATEGGRMRIGEAARRAGTTPRMLRYYEAEGLLEPGRGENGYRDYDEECVVAAARIVALSRAGLPLATIRLVLPCAVGGGEGLHLIACPWIAAALRDQLAAIRARIAELDDGAVAIGRQLAMLERMEREDPEAVARAARAAGLGAVKAGAAGRDAAALDAAALDAAGLGPAAASRTGAGATPPGRVGAGRAAVA